MTNRSGNMHRVIETVFFDGDQTLWDFDTLMRRALSATLTELRRLCPGAATDRLRVDSMIADRQSVADELRGREFNLERVRLAAFRKTVTRLKLRGEGLAEHLTAFYLQRRFSDVELYPETLATLTTLQRRYNLGLLSNGNGYPDRSGLSGIFSVVVLSQDHDIAKPDRRLFDIAAAETSSEAGQIAMVGDSLAHDVTAAQAVGWRGIWLNRDSVPCPDQHSPDAQITSLAQLPVVLTKLDDATRDT